MIRSRKYAARRVRQTLAFANGPKVLLDLASARTPWRRTELTFRTRGGSVVSCPNVAGARLAVYEHFVEDLYQLGTLLDGIESPVVLDLGGQVGAFAVAVAARYPDAVVHVYEASPSTAEWLRRNVAANQLDGRVHVHAEAVAGESGTIAFTDNGEASVHNGLTAPEGSGTTVNVPAVTFAQAVAAAGGRADVVKADIEGAEYDMVLASTAADWAGVQRIVMEYHPVAGHSWAELEAFFAEAGLQVTHRDPITDGLGTVWLSR